MTPTRRTRPWREMVRLRPELQSGELSLAQFAADLHEVVRAAGTRPVYEDPARFFALTYPTHAIRELAKDVARRLAGESDKAVRQLELTYGGGKTHTLITLHHLFRDPDSLPDIPAVKQFREHCGRLPRAFTAVLCFDKIDVEKGIRGVRGPDGETRTLRHPWSVLAFQLAGDDGLRSLHGEGKAEERETPPAEPLLAELIAKPQERGLGTLILVDEVLMYARTRMGSSPVWRARIQDFFQHLVQAVVKVDRAALVASLLATDPEKERGDEGKRFLGELMDVFRRQKEEGVQPVGEEDVAEVLRRQFFLPEDLADPDCYHDQVIAAVRDLGKVHEPTRKGGREEEARFAADYPFHPYLTKVFYSGWTQLEKFQRTRGILRTLAIALREAERWDRCPLIGPAALLAEPGARSASDALSELAGVATSEETGGKRTQWKQLLELELERARQVQIEIPGLARGREVEQAVVAVFLHSQPLGHRAHTPDLLRLIGSGAPDRIELEKGLRRWRDLSWFLDDEDGAGADGAALPKTWRLGNKPNLRQMHDQAIRQRVTAAAVEARLDEAIRKTKKLTEGASAAGAAVHLLPVAPADLADDRRFHFGVLGPAAASESGQPSAAAKRFLDETTGPGRPRVHRNAVVLAVPSREGIEAARSAVRNLLGWEEVASQLEEGPPVDLVRGQRLRANLKEARARLPEAVRQAYAIVVATDRGDRVQAFRLPAEGGPLFLQIKNDERSRIQETAVEPAALLPGGPYELWKEGETTRRVPELAEAFARYSRLPKLLKPEVVRDTVLRAVAEGLLVGRLSRPDGSVRTFWRETVDPETGRSPDLEGVLPERARLERLPERLLAPDALPELWSGGQVAFAELVAYFGGGRRVRVAREGFEEELVVPACDPGILREAATRAVEQGIVWLRNGPTSLWKETPPAGALDGQAALWPPPAISSPQELTAEALPGGWREGATNGALLTRALGQQRGEALPWGLVRESIRGAVNARWLRITGGEADCAFDQAGQLLLERPPETPEPPTPVAGGGAGGAGSAVLEAHDLQTLADEAPELVALAAGSDLRFRVRPELVDDADAETRSALNERLAKISADLKVE